MSPPTESPLLTRLEASDYSDLPAQISAFLQPFRPFLAPLDEEPDHAAGKKKKRADSKPKQKGDPKLLRPLAKKFLPFLSRLLKLLPARLSECPIKGSAARPPDETAIELFRVYRLALDCLACISPCIAAKPFMVHLLRVRLVRCLETWGRYEEAEREGFGLLESLKSLVLQNPSRVQKSKKSEVACYLPGPNPENSDPELAFSVAETVVCLVACVYKSQSKNVDVYRRVLALVEQAEPWIRVLDTRECEKFRGALVSALYKCALVMLLDSEVFNGDLTHQFCMTTLTECLSSPMKDQFPKMARKVCSSFEWKDGHSLFLDILRCSLELLVCECKVNLPSFVNEVFDFLHYFSSKCCNSSGQLREHAAELLDSFEMGFPGMTLLSIILSAYAAGLYSVDVKIREHLQRLAAYEPLNNFFCDGVVSICSEKGSRTCKNLHGGISLSSSIHAFDFLCKPLADSINTTWKHVILGQEKVPFYSDINYVQDVFHHFCETFLTGIKNACERERERLYESRATLLHVSMASFRVFLRTNRSCQKSMDFIDSIISSDWIEPQELRYLASSLYNIGVSLYNSKDFEKASLSLDLCYRAVWTHVSHQCSQFSQRVDPVKMNILEESIKESVSDACSKTAIFLDVLYECGNPDMNKVIANSLIHWSRARELLNVAGPNVLVKQWVKIMFKVGTNANVGDQPQSLCSLIPSVCEKATTGIILDQELSAFAELEARNPDLCIKMQLKIITILLQDVYITNNYSLQKSILLVKKGRLLRASGIDGLKNCSECLSEAISVLKDAFDGTSNETALMYHHLALTHCLHALCTQEADQDIEVILYDISCAIKLWSSTKMVDIFSSDDFILEFEKALPLLYHVADLLSLKGCLDYHFEIYKLIITIGQRNNVSLEKILAMLWDDRRLNHALCISPIDGGLLLKFSNHFGSQTKSFDFWIDCTDGQHPSSLLGFLQNFTGDSLRVFQVDLNHLKKSPPVNISANKIKETACALLSSVPKISQQIFLAGHLYYDLSERLISSGRLYEALSTAREALLIRTKLLQKKFIYFVGNDFPDMTKAPETKTDDSKNHIHLEVMNSAATEFWPDTPKLRYSGESVHSPWNVLKCYLESCFQVGIIHELTGNGADAEALLLMGKKLSCFQGLPLLRVAFGTMLGRIYCKKHMWHLAESELDECKHILRDCNKITSCDQCKLCLQITLDLQFGDLIRTKSSFAPQINPSEGLPSAVNLYSIALDKLNISELDYVKSNKSNNTKTSSRRVPEKHTLKTRCSKVTRAKNCSLSVSSQHHENFEQDLLISSTKFDAKKEISMLDVISLKWECHQRRIAINLLMKIGKSAISFWEIHEVHAKFCLGVSLLFRGYIFSRNFDVSDFLELMGEEIPNDVFVMERATLLYEISWFSLKNSVLRQSSKVSCCNLSNIQMSKVISWLLQAFIISRELPMLFQKVSRLLATVVLLSTATGQPFLPVHCGDSLSSSHWAAFFHQASVGAYLHHQYYSVSRGKYNSCNSMACEGIPSAATSSSEALSVRFVPEKLENLQQFVQNFFISLPSVTIICISMLGGRYADLIMEMLHLPSSFPAWLLFTRFYSQKEPVVMLLPVDSVVEETSTNDEIGATEPFTMDTAKSKKWTCPWGYTLIDNVVPQFKSILEENYLSSSNPSPIDTKENRILWWTRRTRLNDRLDKLLKNVEDSWLGPWKSLFLGERLDSGYLDGVLANLMGVLRNKYHFHAHEYLLKTILNGELSLYQREECVSQLFLYRGYFGRGGSCGEKRCGLFSSFCIGVEDECGSLRQLILEAISEVEEEVMDREPVVLVMDADIQMLPWESLPALRQQEVYRMPSVGSIHVALNQPKTSGFSDIFPSVDPSDAYFLLNPSGDLSNTQLEFEEWFKSQNWEGRAGNVPSTKELAAALQSRDLFIYFGHGSGIQYIPRHEIQKLERCAATLLMGCSSGCLSLNGIYAPLGAPISYLLAGSPAIVSNLWDVTDKDIDRFGKVIVDAWLQEVTKPATVCDRCNQMVKEFESLAVGNKKNCVPRTRKKALKGKKLQENNENCKCKNNCRKVRLASFMGQARDACRFPFLIGASPVCYGVPTVIRKRGS